MGTLLKELLSSLFVNLKLFGTFVVVERGIFLRIHSGREIFVQHGEAETRHRLGFAQGLRLSFQFLGSHIALPEAGQQILCQRARG